jgi:hypothetical protein
MMMDPLHRKVRPLERRKKRRPLSEEIKNGVRVLSLSLVILGFIGMGGFLRVSSQKSVMGYTLQQLQVDYETLSSERRILEAKIIQAQSYQKIGQTEILNEMESPEKPAVSYVDGSSHVATDPWTQTRSPEL